MFNHLYKQLKWILCIFIVITVLQFGSVRSCLADLSKSDEFSTGIAYLHEKSFSKKSEAIEKLALSEDPRSEQILQALLDGVIYIVKKEKTLVYARPEGKVYALINVLTGVDIGVVKKRKIKKVGINNNLRLQLKAVLARMRLSHSDPKIRLAAVNKMLGTFTPDSAHLLTDMLKAETDKNVKKALNTALSLLVLRSGPEKDKKERLAALRQLSGNLQPAVRRILTDMSTNETDEELRNTAKIMLGGIETKIAFIEFFETLFFGLSMGSVLVLAAIGLAITFGVIGVINMAHGELIMLGAYTTYVLQQLLPDAIGVALFLSIPAAFAVSGMAGIIIERTIIKFLYGRPLETLLATFGISLILQQAVRTIFTPLNRSVVTPGWMSGAIQLNPVLSLTTNRVVILIFALLVFAGLSLLLNKSSIGLQVRAVSQNRLMARAMGVRAARVDALTFGLGSGIAGIAGVALSQLTNVGPNLGQAYIVDSFMVVVFGGVGNLWGTLIGGIFLGVMNKFLEPWTGAVLGKIFILVIIILFIQKRPQGLFPQKGRAAG